MVVSPPTAPSRSARALPLLWHGLFRDPSGYADEARSILMALERAGYEVVARDSQRTVRFHAGLDAAQLATNERAMKRPAPSGSYVLARHYVPMPGLPRHADGPVAMHTMFETDRIPSGWRQPLLAVDEVWVPCPFNVETFQRGGIPASRIRELPMTIDFDRFAPGAAEPLSISGLRGFTFLANFDFNDRKGWDVLLDAWADAFGPDDDVSLLLKCVSLHGLNEAMIRERIETYLRGRRTAPIVINTDVLPCPICPASTRPPTRMCSPAEAKGGGGRTWRRWRWACRRSALAGAGTSPS